MTTQIYCLKTYHIVCYFALTDHLIMISFDNYFKWLALEPTALMNPTVNTIFLN